MASGKTAAGWLADELTNRWVQALEGMTGEKPSVEWAPVTGPAPAGVEWWEQPLSFPTEAIVYAGATRANAIQLGGKVLEAAGVEPSAEDASGTYLETLNQALSGLRQGLTARLRKEVTCTGGRTCSEPDPKASGLAAFRITLSGQSPIELLAAFSPSLLSSLEPEDKQAKQVA